MTNRASDPIAPGLARALALAVAAAAATLVVFAGLSMGPGVATAEADCANARTPARDLSVKALRGALTCEINALRRSKGRPVVRPQSQLQRVAQRHTKRMVEANCLKHRCAGEAPLHERIRRSGYRDGAESWEFVQNTGCAINVKIMVKTWRQSTYHRQNLLKGRLQDAGIGALPRRPNLPRRCGDRRMGTFTALLAWRRP